MLTSRSSSLAEIYGIADIRAALPSAITSARNPSQLSIAIPLALVIFSIRVSA